MIWLLRSRDQTAASRPRRRFVLRRLRRAPRVAIADAAEAVAVHVGGVVVADETTTAPVSGRACVYWQLSLHGTWSWYPSFARAEGGTAFYVDDGGARAYVEPRLAEVALVGELVGRLDDHVSPAMRQAVLARCGRFEIVPGRIWFRERILAPGVTAHVLGAGVREPDTERVRAADGLRGGAPTRLHFRASAASMLLVGDDPRLDRRRPPGDRHASTYRDRSRTALHEPPRR